MIFRGWMKVYLNKNIFILLVFVLFFSISKVSSDAYLEPNVSYQDHVQQTGNIELFYTYLTNSSNNHVHFTFNCNHCYLNFHIDHELNHSITSFTIGYSRPETVYQVTNESSFTVDYTLQTNGTFYFFYGSSNHKDIDVLITMKISTFSASSNPLSQPFIDFFPFILVAFIILVALAFLITRWQLSRSKIAETIKRTSLVPSIPIIESFNKTIPKEFIQSFWQCPTDKSWLQLVTNRVSGSPSFIISKDNIKLGISNAIAVRKIPESSEIQTVQLVNLIFTQFSIEDIALVNTRCPVCKNYFSAPQL